MTSIGITGHQRLSSAAVWPWVEGQIRATLALLPEPIVGLTSLAIGADQLFAEAVLSIGGRIEAVLPFDGYTETFSGPDLANFNRLLALSSRTEVLDRAGSDEESYFTAGKRVVELSDLMIAVWDGAPAKGLGGTADIVHYAIALGRRVVHINPAKRVIENLVPAQSHQRSQNG